MNSSLPNIKPCIIKNIAESTKIMCLTKWVVELTPEIKRQCWEKYYK